MNHVAILKRSRAAQSDCMLIEIVKESPGRTFLQLQHAIGFDKSSIQEKIRFLKLAGLVRMEKAFASATIAQAYFPR
jgi:predicted transcriptional regulator